MKLGRVLNKANLLYNLRVIRRVSGGKKVCCVVKADAYGHGLNKVVQALSGKADFFGVATLDEALLIREINKTTPILVLGTLEKEEYIKAVRNDISVTVFCLKDVKYLNSICSKKYRVKIHIKVNSGMNRLGLDSKIEMKDIIKIIDKSENLKLEGLFTHYSTADLDLDFLKKQSDVFKEYVSLVEGRKVIVHIGGSSCLEKSYNFNYVMVRTGLNLYGYDLENKDIFKPCLKVYSKIIEVRNLKNGDRLGYSNSFIAKTDCKVGVIFMGYADGMNKALSNRHYVKVNGCKCKILGNICMDMFFCDLTKAGKVHKGSRVLVYENANKWAEVCNEIPYEILVNLSLCRINN